jgi:predicted TPR repeat methyltransferase
MTSPQISSAEYYDGFWERFGTSANQHPANLYRYNLIHEALQSLPHGNDCLIDLGCGNGALIQQMQAKHSFQRFVGFDTSPEVVRMCQRALPQYEFQQADLQEAPLDKWASTADVVVCTEVIEHMEVYKPLLQSAATILKPGGLFILTTQGGKRRRHDIELLGHVRHYDLDALAEDVGRTGLSIERKTKSGFPILNLQKIAASIFIGKVRKELASPAEPSMLFRFACVIVGWGLKLSARQHGPQLLIAARKV